MNINKYISKKFLRQNFILEFVSYFIQNNVLRNINFNGTGNWDSTFSSIYERFISIANGYLNLIKSEKIEINNKTLIIELGVGLTTAACLELSKKTKCYKVIAYDAFMVLNESVDKTIKEKYYSEINNVIYILGIEELRKFLNENNNNYNKIIVFSTTVLQHVWKIKELISVIDNSSSINSVHFHTIDFKHMNKFGKYGILYYLKFSDFTWRLIAKNVGYQNRLRYNNYVDLFNEFGYKIDLLNAEMFKDSDIQIAKQTYLKNMEISKNETLNYSAVSIKCIKLK